MEAAKLVEELIVIIVSRIRTNRLVLPVSAVAEDVLQRIDTDGEAGDKTLSAIANMLQCDPLLVSQLYYVAVQKGAAPQSIGDVIETIGTQEIREAVSKLSRFPSYESRSRRIRTSFQRICGHSVAVATGAQMVAERLHGAVTPQMAYLAGLLHTSGRAVVGVVLLEAEKMLGMTMKDWISNDMWRTAIEESHEEIQVALADKWKFPVRSESDDTASADCNNIVLFVSALAARHRIGAPSQQGSEPDQEVELELEALEDLVAEGVERLSLDWVFVHSTLREEMEQCVDRQPHAGESTQSIDVES